MEVCGQAEIGELEPDGVGKTELLGGQGGVYWLKGVYGLKGFLVNAVICQYKQESHKNSISSLQQYYLCSFIFYLLSF